MSATRLPTLWRQQRIAVLAALSFNLAFFLVCAVHTNRNLAHSVTFDDEKILNVDRRLYRKISVTAAVQTLFALFTVIAMAAYTFFCARIMGAKAAAIFSKSDARDQSFLQECALVHCVVTALLTLASLIVYFVGIQLWREYESSLYTPLYWMRGDARAWVFLWILAFLSALTTVVLSAMVYFASRRAEREQQGVVREEIVVDSAASKMTQQPQAMLGQQPTQIGQWTST